MADPIGIRNSNPGNIRVSGIDWEGAVGEEGGFVKFDGPVAGGKALIKNLMSYDRKYGINTVEGIINRWAPPSENDTGSYVNVVAGALGVDPRDPLDMRSPVVLGKLASTIAKHENGRDFDSEFFRGVASNVVQGTPMDPLTQAYAQSAKQPSFTKALNRTQAVSDHSPVDLSTAAEPGAFADKFPLVVDGPSMYEQDAGELANKQLRAGFKESMLDSMVNNTVIGKMVEMSQRGEDDPNFDAMSEENKKRAQAARLYGNEQAMDYVLGARNNEDFTQRLETAQERVDFQRRMANTEGLAFAGVVAGQLVGGVADPPTLIATMGMGAAVAAARGAAAAGRALTIAKSGAYAAGENIAIGQVIERADNRRFSWGTLMEQGVMGAGLGALGGLMVSPRGHLASDPSVRVAPEAMPILRGAERSVNDVMEGAVNRASDEGQIRLGEQNGNYKDDSISTDIHQMEMHELNLTGPLEIKRTETTPVQTVNARHNDSISRDMNPSGGMSGKAALDHIAAQADDPMTRALAGRLREQMVDDVPIHGDATLGAGALYDPRAHRVLVGNKVTDSTILHEVAHSSTVAKINYGKANPDTPHGKLVSELENLRQEAQKAYKGSDKEAKYFLSNTDEFVAGLYSGKSEFTDFLASVKAEGGNLLNKVVEVIRGLLGVPKEETNALLKAIGLTDDLIDTPLNTTVLRQDGADFSIRQRPEALDGEPLNTREARLAEALDAVGEQLDPNAKQTVERGQSWLAKRPEWFKKGDLWAMSPGTVLSASKSKVTRIASSILFENALGSSKRHSTVAMGYEMMQRGYRDPFIMAVQEDMVKLMTPKEKVDFAFWSGSRKAVDRISKEVAEERLKHRAAVQRKEEFVSTAPPEIQRIARQMDNQVDKMTRDGVAYGNEYADNVRGSGWVGFMPQVWKWDKFGDALRNEPAKWQSLKKNFTQQYVEKNVDPVIKQLLEEGADPIQVEATRARLMQQVDHQVNTRMSESVRDPNTRTNMDTNKFETMAAELLDENWHGQKITDKVTNDFRRLLAEKIKDRSRTEFDLLREVDGVRLIDYVEHDLMSTIQHTAHRFAGQNAMAKAGFKDPADFEALITLATKDGATPDEVELLAFAGRAFGLRPMIAKDHPMLATMKNFTYAATMGKLGIASLADVSAVVTSTGVKNMFKVLGYGFRGNTELVNLLGKRGMGLIGQDYRIHNATADVLPNGRALTGVGMGLHRVSVKAAQLVSYINGSNFVQKMLHKGFLPVMAEDLTTAIRGGEGGMSLKRMADAGLDGETIGRIKAQLDQFESGRKEGDGFKWSEWTDQQAADKMIEAMHRITYQTFQRGLVGEAAMWRSESAMGSLIGQFHNFGLTSMEKQLGRNLAINDMNTYNAMAIGMSWSALLYYSRLQLNTQGMSKSDAKEYMDRNTTPSRLTQGVLTYFNMSGIGAELVGVGEVVFGGNTYQGGSGPVAAMGYLGNLSKAANSAGSLLTGQSENGNRDARNILRILPGGNSVIGTYYSNVLRDE